MTSLVLIKKSLTSVYIVRNIDSPRGNFNNFVDLFTGLIVSNRYKWYPTFCYRLIISFKLIPGFWMCWPQFFHICYVQWPKTLYFIRSNANKGFLMLLQLEDGDSSLEVLEDSMKKSMNMVQVIESCLKHGNWAFFSFQCFQLLYKLLFPQIFIFKSFQFY